MELNTVSEPTLSDLRRQFREEVQKAHDGDPDTFEGLDRFCFHVEQAEKIYAQIEELKRKPGHC